MTFPESPYQVVEHEGLWYIQVWVFNPNVRWPWSKRFISEGCPTKLDSAIPFGSKVNAEIFLLRILNH